MISGNKKIAVIACSGIIDLINEALNDVSFEYKIFSFKAPCLFNIENKYFEHYFEKAQKYSKHIIAVMGSCSKKLSTYTKIYNVKKVSGDNCYEMIIPENIYYDNLPKKVSFYFPLSNVKS